MQLYTTSPSLDNAIMDSANWADEEGIQAQFRLAALERPSQETAPGRVPAFLVYHKV